MSIRRTNLLISLLGVTLAACSTVTETGRSQFLLFPESQMTSMAIDAYAEATKPYREITTGPDAEMVQRLGRRLAIASGRKLDWEFKLLDAPDTVNAFALPGGKVAIFSGILPVAGNEDALAAVVGHEIAHATSHHGNERMSQGFAVNLGMALGASALELSSMSNENKGYAIAALGGVTQFGVLLPYSRTQEAEADEIGLRFLIRAGYDPYEAPKLWDRMAKNNPDRPPEFLSTHPDSERRAARLRELIPKIQSEESAGR